MCIRPKSHCLEQGETGQSQGWRSPQCESWASSPPTEAGHLDKVCARKITLASAWTVAGVEQCCRLLVTPHQVMMREEGRTLSNLEVTVSRHSVFKWLWEGKRWKMRPSFLA